MVLGNDRIRSLRGSVVAKTREGKVASRTLGITTERCLICVESKAASKTVVPIRDLTRKPVSLSIWTSFRVCAIDVGNKLQKHGW